MLSVILAKVSFNTCKNDIGYMFETMYLTINLMNKSVNFAISLST